MKKIEWVLAAITALSLLLAVFQLDTSLFFIVSIASLMTLYMYCFEVIVSDLSFQQGLERRMIGLRFRRLPALYGLGATLVCLGVLFKWMGWPGNDMQLKVGLGAILVISAIGYRSYSKDKPEVLRPFIIRQITFGIVALMFMLISRQQVLQMRFGKYPDYVEAVEQYWENPDSEELRERMLEERRKMKEGE